MKLQVIQTDKGLVAVESEPIKAGSTFSILGTNLFNGFDKVGKVLATDTSFKLDGVPQFEVETIETMACRAIGEGCTPINHGHDCGCGYWEEGYKAAQAKGCYTEEDMRKAIYAAAELGFRFVKGTLNGLHWELAEGTGYKIIESLKKPKKLVAIEVESKELLPEFSAVTRTISEQYPDGLLTVKQYYYE